MAIISRKAGKATIATARKPSKAGSQRAKAPIPAVIAGPAPSGPDDREARAQAMANADAADRLWRELVRRVKENG